MAKRVLFIVPYPIGKAASQRFRFEQYFPLLEEHGIEYTLKPFLNEKSWAILYKKGFFFQKFIAIVGGYFKRMGLLFSLRKV